MTTIGPAPVVPAATVSLICVADTGMTVATLPLIVGLSDGIEASSGDVTVAPMAPEVGFIPEMVVAFTVKGTALLITLLLLVTTTLPVVAVVGTFAVIDVSLQLVISETVAGVPLNSRSHRPALRRNSSRR